MLPRGDDGPILDFYRDRMVITQFTDNPVRDLLPHRGPARFLFVAAGAMAISAAVHTGVFLLDDRPWAGPTSWRKPIVFSISLALLLWAFGWVLDRLPDRRRLAWAMALPFAIASSAELLLITIQTWRNRASHFNDATPGDSLIFTAMGFLVGIMSILLIVLFVRSLLNRPADPLERTAAVAGLLLVMSGLGIGQWIIALGNAYVEQFNSVPETVINGEAGVAKFPHAVAFHGIQVFMFAAALLRRSGISSRNARNLLRAVVAAYVGAFVFSALQSFDGRAPFDLDIVSGPLLAASVAGLAISLGTIVAAWLRLRIDAGAQGIVSP